MLLWRALSGYVSNYIYYMTKNQRIHLYLSLISFSFLKTRLEDTWELHRNHYQYSFKTRFSRILIIIVKNNYSSCVYIHIGKKGNYFLSDSVLTPSHNPMWKVFWVTFRYYSKAARKAVHRIWSSSSRLGKKFFNKLSGARRRISSKSRWFFFYYCSKNALTIKIQKSLTCSPIGNCISLPIQFYLFAVDLKFG